MYSHLFFVLSIVLTVFLSACNYRFEKMPKATANLSDLNKPVIGTEDGVITFAKVKEKIFKTNQCFECHDGTRRRAVNLNKYSETVAKYVVPGNPEKSKLYLSLLPNAEQPMPPDGTVSEADIEYIRQWILEGAKETVETVEKPDPTVPEPTPVLEPTPLPTPPPTPVETTPPSPVPFEVTYKVLFEKFLDKRCVQCHSGEKPKRVNLKNYSEVMKRSVIIGAPELSDLYTLVIPNEDGEVEMPTKGPALTAQETQMIKDWILAGAPEGESLDKAPTSPPPVLTDITFAVVKEKVIEKRCNGCHDGSLFHYETNFNIFEDLMSRTVVPGKPEESSFYTTLLPDANGVAEMPKNGDKISDEEINLVKQWILNGAKP